MTSLRNLFAVIVCCVSVFRASAEETDPASLTAQEQAEKLGIELPRLPWHVADFWWYFDKPVEHFESLDVDITIDRDLPDDVNLYISPLGVAELNGLQCYGGLQTNVNGWAGKESRERVHPGRGAIFSRWSTEKNNPIGLGHVRMPAGGLCESAGYEGEFCSVRRPFGWGKGTHTYSIIKGDTETVDGKAQTWFHCMVRSHQTQVSTYVGSLRFEGTDFTYWPRHSAFLEIYSTAKIPKSKIPRVVVTFGYPRLNGKKPELKSAKVNYNAEGGAKAPACAVARAEGDSIVAEIGPIFVRDNARNPGKQELPLKAN